MPVLCFEGLPFEARGLKMRSRPSVRCLVAAGQLRGTPKRGSSSLRSVGMTTKSLEATPAAKGVGAWRVASEDAEDAALATSHSPSHPTHLRPMPPLPHPPPVPFFPAPSPKSPREMQSDKRPPFVLHLTSDTCRRTTTRAPEGTPGLVW